MVKKIQKHIEIVCSSVNSLSSMGIHSSNDLFELLSLHYSSVGISNVETLNDLQKVAELKPDLVFVGIKYIYTSINKENKPTNKIWVTQFLETQNIAYTGSNWKAHALEHDKQLAKQQVLLSGYSTSPFQVIKNGLRIVPDSITVDYPVFIKPTNKGGGCGIDEFSVAYDFDSLQKKITSISNKFNCDSLIEKYLAGREFSVAILKNDNKNIYDAMPLELIAPMDSNNRRILTGDVKRADTEMYIPVKEQSMKNKINELAINIFHALDARDYGRIDLRMDEEGILYFLEANLIPSILKNYGNFPKACMLNAGIEYEDMILRIVRLGLNRSEDITNQYTSFSLNKLSNSPIPQSA